MKKYAPISSDPLKFINNINSFKRIINGFKTTDKESLIDILMYQPKLINSCMTKGFKSEDAHLFKLSCKVYYNIPLMSSAWFGPEKGYSLKSSSSISISDLNREELSHIINSLYIPHKIMPVNFEMKQTIDNIESTFSFKIK